MESLLQNNREKILFHFVVERVAIHVRQVLRKCRNRNECLLYLLLPHTYIHSHAQHCSVPQGKLPFKRLVCYCCVEWTWGGEGGDSWAWKLVARSVGETSDTKVKDGGNTGQHLDLNFRKMRVTLAARWRSHCLLFQIICVTTSMEGLLIMWEIHNEKL